MVRAKRKTTWLWVFLALVTASGNRSFGQPAEDGGNDGDRTATKSDCGDSRSYPVPKEYSGVLRTNSILLEFPTRVAATTVEPDFDRCYLLGDGGGANADQWFIFNELRAFQRNGFWWFLLQVTPKGSREVAGAARYQNVSTGQYFVTPVTGRFP